MSNAVASLLGFERAIKWEKGVTTSVSLPSFTVDTPLWWMWPSCMEEIFCEHLGSKHQSYANGREERRKRAAASSREALPVPPVKWPSPARRSQAGGH